MDRYNPLDHSVVQAMEGGWREYECGPFEDALLQAILKEIKRVHWNVYQHQWEPTWYGDDIEDPEIDGITFTRFYQDACDCEGEDRHSPTCRSMRPNFAFDGVEVSWYKHPGRGMSTNKDWSAEEWKDWFLRCIKHVGAFQGGLLEETDRKRRDALREDFEKRHGLTPRIRPA